LVFGLGRDGSIVDAGGLAANAAIRLHEFLDPLRQSLADHDISITKAVALFIRRVVAAAGHMQMSAYLVARPSRYPLVVSAMTVRTLAESFGDERGNPCRASRQLITQFGIVAERWPLEDRRNSIGRFERLLMNLQILQRCDDHIGMHRIVHAGTSDKDEPPEATTRSERGAANDQRLMTNDQ
jgi:hypothetical protein